MSDKDGVVVDAGTKTLLGVGAAVGGEVGTTNGHKFLWAATVKYAPPLAASIIAMVAKMAKTRCASILRLNKYLL